MEEVKAIIGRLLILSEEAANRECEVKLLWEAFYQIADREAGEANPFRYLDEETGMVLARSIAHHESINPERLQSLLSPSQWLKVSRAQRILEPSLLEAAMIRGQVSKEAVEECTERKRIPRRYGPCRASKEDLDQLAAEEARAR